MHYSTGLKDNAHSILTIDNKGKIMHHQENCCHNHNHCHDHNHDHDHDHSHTPQTDTDRIQKIISHWLKHNDDHIKNYHEWSEKAKNENLPEVSKILKEVADISVTLNDKFQKALSILG